MRTLDVQPVTSDGMAGNPKWNLTKHRSVRLEDDLWDPLEAAALAAGFENRSALIRAFVRWYMRKPGAKLPPRPPVPGAQLPQRPDRPTED